MFFHSSNVYNTLSSRPNQKEGKKYKSKTDDLSSLNWFLGRDWQKFFDTPTALERKRMDMVRKDFTEGKVKQQVPATITYISNDLPMLPGEAGLRCVKQVSVISIVRLWNVGFDLQYYHVCKSFWKVLSY